MEITKRLNSILKIQLFICLTSSMSFGFANTEAGSTSYTKLSATDLNNFSEKTKQENKKDSSKRKSNNNSKSLALKFCNIVYYLNHKL